MTAFMNLKLIEKLGYVEIKYGSSVEKFYSSMLADNNNSEILVVSYINEEATMTIKETKVMNRKL